jgi:diaminohydroxyphosphoribosylaminopyrimidine deaminase/5-amino-6-(5-phosphoribosylamino)uracil reductase
MVGFNTIISDNPHLDTRYINGNNPVRIILDDKQELKSNYYVFNNKSNTLVISKFLKNKNPSSFICNELHKNNIQSVIVEGGRKTLDLFIKNDCWDEARIFESNQRLDNGIKGPEFRGRLKKRIKIGNDYLKFFKPF